MLIVLKKNGLLRLRNRLFCDAKFDVAEDEVEYQAIRNTLPKMFGDPSVFCAQKEGSDYGTCYGDSGGPMARFYADDPNEQKWYQVAVVRGSPVSCDGSRCPVWRLLIVC